MSKDEGTRQQFAPFSIVGERAEWGIRPYQARRSAGDDRNRVPVRNQPDNAAQPVLSRQGSPGDRDAAPDRPGGQGGNDQDNSLTKLPWGVDETQQLCISEKAYWRGG